MKNEITLKPIQFPVNPELHITYQAWLPPQLHCCLEGIDPYGIKAIVVGYEAYFRNHPVGIILATAHTRAHTALIHFLYVDPKNSKHSIESALLQNLTDELAGLGTTLATYTYATNLSSASDIEKAFIEQDWKGPRPFIIDCLFFSKNFNPPWWNKQIDLPMEFEIIPWNTLSGTDKKNLENRYAQGTIPSYVYPFGKDQDIIEPKNSLIMKYEGNIIGWMVTHRLAPDTVRYSALYIEDAFLNSNCWIKLLIEALEVHRKPTPGFEYGKLEINLEQIPKSWLRFVERRLMPYASKITHKNQFWKSISSKTKQFI